MKATLMIEVSRKGGKDCLARIGKWCGALIETECNAENCPLEIQEKPKSKPICNDCILSYACSNYRKDGKCSQSF